jgi:hypothetical protein
MRDLLSLGRGHARLGVASILIEVLELRLPPETQKVLLCLVSMLARRGLLRRLVESRRAGSVPCMLWLLQLLDRESPL